MNERIGHPGGRRHGLGAGVDVELAREGGAAFGEFAETCGGHELQRADPGGGVMKIADGRVGDRPGGLRYRSDPMLSSLVSFWRTSVAFPLASGGYWSRGAGLTERACRAGNQ